MLRFWIVPLVQEVPAATACQTTAPLLQRLNWSEPLQTMAPLVEQVAEALEPVDESLESVGGEE